MKTIKQLADEIGVSKQAIFYRIKRPPLSNTLQSLTSNVDGVLTVSFDGEKLIKQAFHSDTVKDLGVKEPSNKTPSFDGLFDGSPTTVDSEIVVLLKKNIEILHAQLETKDKQIESLTKQQHELTSALVLAQQNAVAAQALHAGTMKHIASDKEKKPSIINRLFKRNKDIYE